MLANRLTENKKWNVLLIEAGKVETAAQNVPVMAAYMQSTAYNWGYWSEPQEGSCIGNCPRLSEIKLNCEICDRNESAKMWFPSRQSTRREFSDKLHDLQSWK